MLYRIDVQSGRHSHWFTNLFIPKKSFAFSAQVCPENLQTFVLLSPAKKVTRFIVLKKALNFCAQFSLLTRQKEWNTPTRVFGIIGVTFLLTFLLTIRSEQVQFALKSEITASYLGGIAT